MITYFASVAKYNLARKKFEILHRELVSACAKGSVTKILVLGKKRSGRTIFSRLKLVGGAKFGC